MYLNFFYLSKELSSQWNWGFGAASVLPPGIFHPFKRQGNKLFVTESVDVCVSWVFWERSETVNYKSGKKHFTHSEGEKIAEVFSVLPKISIFPSEKWGERPWGKKTEWKKLFPHTSCSSLFLGHHISRSFNPGIFFLKGSEQDKNGEEQWETVLHAWVIGCRQVWHYYPE